MNSTLTKIQEDLATGQIGQALRDVVIFMFAVDSIGSIFLRGSIWFGIAIVIMASTDHFQKYQEAGSVLRTNLGFFLLFLVVGGALMYLLFGITPLTSTISTNS